MWWIKFILLTSILIKIYNVLSAGKCYTFNVLTGQVAIVTGANSGIGYQTALELARRGAKVILACRDDKKGQKAANSIIRRTKNTTVRYQHLDLSSLDSVRKFVANFRKSEAKLDILINNAGASGMVSKKTSDGIVRDMQVNHFGPFLLTVLLVPLLKKSSPSRVVNVSSTFHKFGSIDRLNEEGQSFIQTFCNSKLCNILFTTELARRLEDTGVTVNCLHPGQVNTSFYRNAKIVEKLRSFILYSFFKSPKSGAQTSIYLAVSDECDLVTGKYFADCKEARTSARAQDEALALKLWSISEELVKLKPEEKI